MPESALPDPNPVSSALLAFLRGIEGRAWVFALAQCGDPAQADAVLAATVYEFAGLAPTQALAQWPLRFWASLLGQPAMRASCGGDDELSMLGPGPRAALLLRVLAGLAPAHAGRVLGISAEAHDLAWQRAQALWPSDCHGIERLHERLHAQVQQMPPVQREHVAQLRERALADARIAATATPVIVTAPGRAGRRWPTILLALSLLGFAATFVPALGGLLFSDPDPAHSPAPAPPGSPLADTTVVIHPDYGQLAAPSDDALAQQLAFLSWVAAGRDVPGATTLASPELSETATAETSAAGGDVESTP